MVPWRLQLEHTLHLGQVKPVGRIWVVRWSQPMTLQHRAGTEEPSDTLLMAWLRADAGHACLLPCLCLMKWPGHATQPTEARGSTERC